MAALSAMAFASKLSVGHQEIDRIIDEVEQTYRAQPTEWLPIAPVGNMVALQWYEDIDEFEDAIGGEFIELLRAMPHIEVRAAADGETPPGFFKVREPDPDAAPRLLTVRVETRAELQRVLYKAPDATVRIPHLEFEIGADDKRRIDTLYNHIAAAVWNLSAHVRGQQGGMPAEQAATIAELIDNLNGMLDVDEPFDVVVVDATGSSQFKPPDGVEELPLE